MVMFEARSNKPGSSMLTVVLIISFIMILCLNVSRMSIVAFDTSLKKQYYEQRKNLMHGIMEWALDLSKNNFETLYEYNGMHPSGFQCEIPSWNIYNSRYTAQIDFKNRKKQSALLSMDIQVLVYEQRNLISKICCCITQKHRDKKPVYKVSAWSSDVS